MKHQGLWAGLEQFEWGRDPVVGYRVPLLREDPGTIHAVHDDKVRKDDEWPREPYFQKNGIGPYALCRRPVLVVLATPFDDRESDLCTECTRIAHERARSVHTWEAERAARIRAAAERRSQQANAERENARWNMAFVQAGRDHPGASEEALAAIVDQQFAEERARDDAEWDARMKQLG